MGRLVRIGEDIGAALAGKRFRTALGLTEEFERVAGEDYPPKDVFALLKAEFASKLSAAAKEAVNDGDYEDAVELLSRVTAVEDGFGEDVYARGSAYSDLAAVHFQAGNFGTSIAVLRDAVCHCAARPRTGPGTGASIAVARYARSAWASVSRSHARRRNCRRSARSARCVLSLCRQWRFSALT